MSKLNIVIRKCHQIIIK